MNRITCLLAFSAAAWGASPASLDYSPDSPAATQIDAYLSQKRSPMAGVGSALTSLGQQYDVDPRLVVAISGAETTFAVHTCAANNAWNWFHHSTCPQSPFASYADGGEHVTRYLRLSYLNRGYNSIELIRYKYCASGCANWIPLVTQFYNEMPAGSPPTAGASNASSASASSVSASAPSTASADNPGVASHGIGGVPLYLILFTGAALVGLWSVRGFRR